MKAVEGFDPSWLRLREPADAEARSPDFAAAVDVPAPLTVTDLGCGIASMTRWLTPHLGAGPTWQLIDNDPRLLIIAGDEAGVPNRTREADLTGLTATDLAGSGLVTASALLDLFTAAQLRTIADAVAGVRQVLFTLTVDGSVRFGPADPLDEPLREAFNDHQRRGGKLGPEATGAMADELRRRGFAVRRAQTPWRLGPDRHPDLLRAWLSGWVGAAVEQAPALAGEAEEYIGRRVRNIDDGDLEVVIGHTDLLAVRD